MAYFSERNGIKKTKITTYQISNSVYNVIMEICKKYLHNLTWKFQAQCHDDFTCKDYLSFNETAFMNRIKIKFPQLFSDWGDLSADIKPNIESQYDFLDFIEYIAQNILDINEGWNHPTYKNFWYIECKNTCDIFNDFQDEINEVFSDAGLLYKLNDNKQIERIVENGVLDNKIEELVELIPEDGIKDLVNLAIEKHRSPKTQDNKDAVEKIWDALERLKTYYIELDKKDYITKIVNDIANSEPHYFNLFNDEFEALTKIGNNYRIRHHETSKIEISDIKHYDYFFNRCLSLISLAIQYLK